MSKRRTFTASPQQTRLNDPNNTDYTDTTTHSHCWELHPITTTEAGPLGGLGPPITFDGILNFCYNEGNLKALEENKKSEIERKLKEGPGCFLGYLQPTAVRCPGRGPPPFAADCGSSRPAKGQYLFFKKSKQGDWMPTVIRRM